MNGTFFIISMQVCNVLYLAYMESVYVANLKNETFQPIIEILHVVSIVSANHILIYY